ncbi:MAG TPA: TolC family protein [Chlorobaculum parvum]|uniref:TolC family protein n=1 Tax=Chlorobaculum parvum TaxID=274539 RepID=A0A7C5HGY6_9CHLB|nr:TolC family protein [Chlorobaculum parvum]
MVNKNVSTLFIFLLLPFAAIRASERPQKSLSLSECISIALQNASSVSKAENARHLTGVELLKSYGSFLPKVSSSASWTPTSVNRSYSVTSPLYGGTSTSAYKTRTETATVSLGVTASLNLFNGLSDYAALQSALDRKKASGFSLQRAKETVAYDVTQSYYQVLLDRELLGIARENLKSADDLLTLTERQFNIGLKSITDLYQQQADTSNSKLEVIKAENKLRRSKLELLRRLRLDPETELTLKPVDTAAIAKLSPDIDLNALKTTALARRADLEAEALQTTAARWDVKNTAGARLPKLDFTFTISSDAIDSYSLLLQGVRYDYPYPSVGKQLENGVDYGLSLNLSWTIFDGFQTRYAVQSAKIAQLNKQLDYEDLKDNIQIDLRQVAGDYRTAFDQIGSARASLKAAKSAYAGILRKYELGASGFVELSASKTALFNARSSVTQALYNLALQKALLDFTAGTMNVDQND